MNFKEVTMLSFKKTRGEDIETSGYVDKDERT